MCLLYCKCLDLLHDNLMTTMLTHTLFKELLEHKILARNVKRRKILCGVNQEREKYIWTWKHKTNLFPYHTRKFIIKNPTGASNNITMVSNVWAKNNLKAKMKVKNMKNFREKFRLEILEVVQAEITFSFIFQSVYNG